MKCFRYREALISVVTNILKKVQFRQNQSNLEELDDETMDDNVCIHLQNITHKGDCLAWDELAPVIGMQTFTLQL